MTPLRVAMIVFLAASIQAQPLHVPPSAAQLREWMGDECVSAGKHVGIDYPGALERAIRREPAGLAELFRYTVIEGAKNPAGEYVLRLIQIRLTALSLKKLHQLVKTICNGSNRESQSNKRSQCLFARLPRTLSHNASGQSRLHNGLLRPPVASSACHRTPDK
jgi:hypothetical protein